MKDRKSSRYSLFIIHYIHYSLFILNDSSVSRNELATDAFQLVLHAGIQPKSGQFDDIAADDRRIDLRFEFHYSVGTGTGQFLQVSFPIRMCLSSRYRSI